MLIGGEIFSTHVPKLSVVEGLGLIVAVIVLLITLGSVVASMMPVGTAIAGVGLGVLGVQIAAGVISVSSTTLMLAIMLGLAVGIDYALFILSRHRDQLSTGMDVEESAARAVGTAGGAVVFAGLTVVIALVGLSIANLPFLTVMGVFGAVTVGIEVLLALTLLPAFLGFAGERLRPKPRKARTRGGSADASTRAPAHLPPRGDGRAQTSPVPAADADEARADPTSAPRPRFSAAATWVRLVTTWPLLTIVVVLVGLGALAYPATDLQMALPTSGRSLPGTQDRETYDADHRRRSGSGSTGR